MSSRPRRTLADRRRIARQAMREIEERHELEEARGSIGRYVGHSDCSSCAVGVHDPSYGDDGVARCLCCGRDMTEDGYPQLELEH